MRWRRRAGRRRAVSRDPGRGVGPVRWWEGSEEAEQGTARREDVVLEGGDSEGVGEF